MDVTIRCQQCEATGILKGEEFPPGWTRGTEPFTYRCPDHPTEAEQRRAAEISDRIGPGI